MLLNGDFPKKLQTNVQRVAKRLDRFQVTLDKDN